MTIELQGFMLMLHLKRFMETDFNPVTDYSLADLPATPTQITEAFKMPWVKRITANGRTWTRQEWAKERSKQNGQHPDLMQ